jgi:hypothetical protein
MLILLAPLLKGISARDLGISSEGDGVGYIQCINSRWFYTYEGTVIFEKGIE